MLTTSSSSKEGEVDLHVFPSGSTQTENGSCLNLLIGCMRPASRGRVTLADADARVAPHVDLKLLQHPDDLPRLVSGIRIACRLGDTSPVVDYLTGEDWPGADIRTDDQLASVIQERVSLYHHPAGTCRMGSANDPIAVVDSEGNVRGITGLQVVDASIMPTIPSGNTNLLACFLLALLRTFQPSLSTAVHSGEPGC
jgi:choline dehydrogenase